MIVSILIWWNVILTILFIIIVVNNGERQSQIDRIEVDIKENCIYDEIVEDSPDHCHIMGHHYVMREYERRFVTVKEAIQCLYRKCNFHLSYTPEQTKTISEDVKIK